MSTNSNVTYISYHYHYCGAGVGAEAGAEAGAEIIFLRNITAVSLRLLG